MIPDILKWPMPWIWVFLTLWIGADAYSAKNAVFLVFIVTIATVIIHSLHVRSRRQGQGSVSTDNEVKDRLTRIERRLTDTQEVMIALNEKMDHWEEDPRSRSDQCQTSSP